MKVSYVAKHLQYLDVKYVLILIFYLFHEDYIQLEATGSSPQYIEYGVAPSDKVPNVFNVLNKLQRLFNEGIMYLQCNRTYTSTILTNEDNHQHVCVPLSFYVSPL